MEPTYHAMPPVPPPTERRRYSRLAALVLSFFSPDLYRDVARRWRGIGFWYLVLLLTISWLPIAIKVQVGFAHFVRQDAARTLAGFPAITIKDGVVSIDRPEPYIWREPDSREVLLYVDTTDAFDLPEGATAKIRLGRSKAFVQQSAFESRTYDLSQVKYFYVDGARLMGWLQTATYWVGIGLFAFGLFFTLIWHLIQILIYGVIGLLLASMLGARLDYPALLRLAAVAITPAILLDTVLGMAGVSIPFSGLLFIAIELGYLALAVKVNAEPSLPPPGYPLYPPGYPPPMPPAMPPLPPTQR